MSSAGSWVSRAGAGSRRRHHEQVRLILRPRVKDDSLSGEFFTPTSAPAKDVVRTGLLPPVFATQSSSQPDLFDTDAILGPSGEQDGFRRLAAARTPPPDR